MDQERNLGVTEARFALTIVTCLLVAIGYVVLLRLGGTKETPVEAGADDVSPPIVAGPNPPNPSNDNDLQPRVLTLETPNDAPVRTSQRPGRTPPANRLPEPERR